MPAENPILLQDPQQLLHQRITPIFMGPLDALSGIRQSLAVQQPAESAALQERNRILEELARLQALLALPLTQAMLLTEGLAATHPDIVAAQIPPPQKGLVASDILAPPPPETSPVPPPTPQAKPEAAPTGGNISFAQLLGLLPENPLSLFTLENRVREIFFATGKPLDFYRNPLNKRFSFPPEVAEEIVKEFSKNPELLQKRQTGRPRGRKKK